MSLRIAARVGEYAPIPVPGSQRLRERAVGGVRVAEAIHPPMGVPRMHAHRSVTVSILLAGSVDETTNGFRVRLAGDGAIVRCAGCEHGNLVGAGGARALHLDLVSHDPRDLDFAVPEWRHVGSPHVSLLALALRGELRHSDAAAQLACESLVEEILAHLFDHGERPASPRCPPPWLRRAAEVLQDRYRERLTIAGIAQEVGVHRVTLAREFRRHFRMTPGEYVRRIRLGRALRALAFAERNPSSAALNAGFYDQSHLTRWLRREAGTTPGRMRSAAQPAIRLR